MAQIVRSATNTDNTTPARKLTVAANQTIAIGDLLIIGSASRKLEVAVAATTAIYGIAQEPITTGAVVTDQDAILVEPVRGQVVRLAFSAAGTKKTFADTDKYLTAFDLLNKTTVAPDDVTGGMCFVQAYDNKNLTVDVIIAPANLVNVG